MDRSVPKVSAAEVPGSVVREIERLFGKESVAGVVRLLPAESELPLTPPYERVLMAVVRDSGGDIRKLKQLAQLARIDWRDVLQ